MQIEPAEAAARFAAELHVSLGNVARSQRELGAKIDAIPPQPIPVKLVASVLLDSNGAGVIAFQGPQPGKWWNLMRMIVGGVKRTTTAAGIADLYVSASRQATDPAALSISDLADSTALTTLPSVAFYSAQQVPVKAGEHCRLVISGGTASTQYVAAMQFTEFTEAAIPQAWTQ